MTSYILKNLNEALETYRNIKEDPKIEDIITDVSNICYQALSKGKKILMAGNGGSACDAQHFAAELVGRFKLERRGLSAISLSDNNSAITAIANDYSYADIFLRDLQCFLANEDLVILMSTSGKSKNIVNCIDYLIKRNHTNSIILTGETSYEFPSIIQHIKTPSSITARVQEHHLFLLHEMCNFIDTLF